MAKGIVAVEFEFIEDTHPKLANKMPLDWMHEIH